MVSAAEVNIRMDTPANGEYHFQWRDYHLHIRIDRLEPERKTVNCELLAELFPPGSQTIHVMQSRLDLTSAVERNRIATLLAEKLANVPWATALENIALRTLRHYRKGQPFIWIADMEAPPMDTVYVALSLPGRGGKSQCYMRTAIPASLYWPN